MAAVVRGTGAARFRGGLDEQCTDDDTTPALVHCPRCGGVASIDWCNTIGAMTYAKVHCLTRHWFLLPVEVVQPYQ